MYIKNNSGLRIDSQGTPHVTFCLFVLFLLLMQMYYLLFAG